MSDTQSKEAKIRDLEAMVKGLEKHWAGKTLALNGTTYAVDDVVAQIKAFVARVGATDAAHTAWRLRLQEQNVVEANEITPLMRGLRLNVKAVFGPKNVVVADFGMAPLRQPARSVESREAAVAKSKATRLARNTMGPRQRAKIHGVIAPNTGASPTTKAPPTET